MGFTAVPIPETRSGSDDDNTMSSENRVKSTAKLLPHILEKLRPFQREAFDFATQGERPTLKDAVCSSTGSPINSATKQHSMRPRHRGAHPDDQVGSPRNDALPGKGRILLADEMGLGKTITSLAIMAYYENEWPMLVVCPASLRDLWPAEMEKFFPNLSPQDVYVAAGFHDIGFRTHRRIRVVVVTYSLLQERSAVAQALSQCNFQCVIVDESHYIKQKNSQRAKLLMPILTQARRVVLLSGTPATARPVELWTQLVCLSPTLFGNWTTFVNRYCNPQRKSIGRGRMVWDYSGSSHEQELHEKLQQVMIRRLKSQVLHELPPKQRSTIPVIMMDAKQRKECQRIMTELNGLGSSQDLEAALALMNSDSPSTDNNKEDDFFARRKKIGEAFIATGKGKAPAVADFILDWLEGSSPQEKILVFAHHKEVLDHLDKTLLASRPNGHIRIDGRVQTSIRTQLVHSFQSCAGIRVALLSITAAGVGLTLTAASTVLFAELYWTPGVLAQAEDRAHRIGQMHSHVQIYYMICKDKEISLDPILWNVLGKKIKTLDHIVDGQRKLTPYLHEAEERGDLSPSKRKRPDSDGATTVQDEVREFFASFDDSSRRTSKARGSVKGTILNFFQKNGSENNVDTFTQYDPEESQLLSHNSRTL